MGQVVPGAAVEGAAGAFLLHAAPLLEKERNVRLFALAPDAGDPFGMDWPCAGAGFATHDDPVDAAEIERAQVAEERFERQEFDGCAGVSEMVDAGFVLRGFDADAHPDVRGPVEIAREAEEPAGSLGQDLKLMPMRFCHGGEYPLDERNGHAVMEKIAHGVYEDPLRFLPGERKLKSRFMEGELEAVGVFGLSHGSQAQRHPLRIAVVAAGAEEVTASGWVPSGFGPLD